MSELQKLQAHRNRIKEENQSYIENHPELRTIIDQFISRAIVDKPADIVEFGASFFNGLRNKLSTVGPPPIVFAGPSGVGKGTIVGQLIARFPALFGFSVSNTTRAPRPGEENGVHYNFVSKEEMEEAISRGEFLEHAKVHTNYYGTSTKAVEKVQASGKICILDIDIQGVQNVKKSNKLCKYIFIMPPSFESLEGRLRGRGTETEDKIQVRLRNARSEMEFGATPGYFDAVVINDDLERSIQEVLDLLRRWYPSISF